MKTCIYKNNRIQSSYLFASGFTLGKNRDFWSHNLLYKMETPMSYWVMPMLKKKKKPLKCAIVGFYYLP